LPGEAEVLKAKVQSRATEPADPRWYLAELVDVRTGEGLTPASLQGYIVMVETMAVWCGLCLQQQLYERGLLQEGIEGVAFVSRDIDPIESETVLAEHAAKHHLDWRFAIAPQEVARALRAQFGSHVLHPPAVPVILIDDRGQARMLSSG
jgi:hypothetical protein